MVHAIWNLYTSIEEKVVLPDRINIILPTRGGEFKSAKELYLGKEYKKGQILEYLYAHIDQDIIVTDPNTLGFSETSKELESFLCWMGVSSEPRIIEKNRLTKHCASPTEILPDKIGNPKIPSKNFEPILQKIQILYENKARPVSDRKGWLSERKLVCLKPVQSKG